MSEIYKGNDSCRMWNEKAAHLQVVLLLEDRLCEYV